MYIRVEKDNHVLIKTVEGADGSPGETILADLGQDPELNLFIAADISRRKNPELWEGVSNLHLLQALENYKRRVAGCKPILVSIRGKNAKAKGK
ncbi:MAG TPA: hypothetical protein VK463_20040 [Desulfomonilaceae bacterium]|nr:hypothetical protein [Desulfomonilaceae bacterium]